MIPYAISLHIYILTLVLVSTWSRSFHSHVESNPFWTWWLIRIHSSMVQLCEWRNLTWCDTMTIGKEGIWPLLQKAIHGSKVMRRRRREVEIPIPAFFYRQLRLLVNVTSLDLTSERALLMLSKNDGNQRCQDRAEYQCSRYE